MQVAVAGATGFIGRAVVAALREAGHTAVALSRGRRAVLPGLGHRRADLVAGGPDLAAALAGCDAVVNLVGIKRPEPGQDFAAAHVEVVRRLIDAMRTAGVARLVHISVTGARDDPARPYRASKFAGEHLVMSSGLAWTIVRPGPVYGPGDDFVRNLVGSVRHAAVFPAPGGGAAPMQPVAVEDVAAAVVAALARPAAAGRAYDVVGPERLSLRALVERVAAAIGLPVRVLPVPVALLRPVVAALERLPDPPLTRSQLDLLAEGFVGDPEPLREELGVTTAALTPARIAALGRDAPPLLGLSLRLRRGDEDRSLRPWSSGLPRAAAIAGLGVVAIAALGAWTEHIWWRMLAANAALAPLCLLAVPLPWRALLRPTPRALLAGLVAALALLPLGWLGSQVLFALAPATRAEVAAVYAWSELLPVWATLPLLLAIAAGEEIVWRGALGLSAAGRLGPWWGCAVAAAAFTAAHVSLGLPALLVAAAGAGFFWTWLALKTRSLAAALVCHVAWDAAVMWLRLY